MLFQCKLSVNSVSS